LKLEQCNSHLESKEELVQGLKANSSKLLEDLVAAQDEVAKVKKEQAFSSKTLKLAKTSDHYLRK